MNLLIAESLYLDLVSCMEDWDGDAVGGGMAAAFFNAKPHGKRVEIEFASRADLATFRGEVDYRREFNLPKTRNPYGCEDPDQKVHAAAVRSLKTIDTLLEES